MKTSETKMYTQPASLSLLPRMSVHPFPKVPLLVKALRNAIWSNTIYSKHSLLF